MNTPKNKGMVLLENRLRHLPVSDVTLTHQVAYDLGSMRQVYVVFST